MSIEGVRLVRMSDGKELVSCFNTSDPHASACHCRNCKLVQNSKECKSFVSETSAALMWR